jgi:hypothetical protein
LQQLRVSASEPIDRLVRIADREETNAGLKAEQQDQLVERVAKILIEPPRFSRRPFGLSYAAIGMAFCIA